MSLAYGFALQPTDDSAAFANALYNVIGDGVAQYGGKFALTVNGFSVTVASGYGLVAGRWVKSDEPLILPVQPAGNTEDRTDAIAARVDYASRTVNLEVLAGIDTAARTDTEYCIILYLIRVRRGATSITPSDITDVKADKKLCGIALPLSAIAGDVLNVYQFLTSGIDEDVNRLVEMSEEVIAKAGDEIAQLNEEVKKAGGSLEVGELITSRNAPTPADNWLLCNGEAVPAEYPALSSVLSGWLPSISQINDRYRTYIYGGKPTLQ